MLEVIDVFCGAGGMSRGLQSAGLSIRAGIDFSEQCIATYRQNFPSAHALCENIADIRAAALKDLLTAGMPFVLAGCPPCQLFSQLHRKSRPVGDEFGHYLRLVWALCPDYLVFENVPRIVAYRQAWQLLLTRLRKRGYRATYKVVSADMFGVPQRRKRLVLVAARSVIDLADPRWLPTPTVRDTIGHLPDQDLTIPNHVTMKLSAANAARIRATPHNGGRSKVLRSAFDDSYGRMRWDAPAPTITTRCISFSNGRFGHPDYDRAMTVREAAALQGFGDDFRFIGGVWETARQVGNAVPPPVAKWLGENILRHYRGVP
jgi:DNA (cytosine-5)-methyltransferase 1